MLKRVIILISSAFVALGSMCAVAKNKIPMVKLYESPSSSKVVATVPVNTDMVPIIYKKDWAKVGVRPNGQVGWVNLPKYEKARSDFFRPDIQTVYINSSENNNGKPTINIVAYKNGEKLSDTQAKAFYKKMLMQQQTEQRAQRRYWHHFNNVMRMQQRDMDQVVNDDSTFMSQPQIILMPGPVILPKDAKRRHAPPPAPKVMPAKKSDK
jgi:hypothetical protein